MSGETRKLQQVGGGTYTVSIPKEWAIEQSLSAGDTVFLYPDGDGSIVVCRDDSETGPTTAAVTLPPHGHTALDRVLSAAYAAGIERLRLTTPDGFDADRRRTLQRMVRERTGMQVTESSAAAVEITTLLDDDQVAVEQTVVQLQFVSLSLFRTAVDAALASNAPAAERIEDRRAEAARLALLVTRQFNRSLSEPTTAAAIGIDRRTAFACYRTAAALERVADHATAIARLDLTEPTPTVEDARSAADATRRYLEVATTSVTDGEAATGVDALQTARDEVTALLADADQGGENRAVERFRWLLEDCLASGDRIATVAREAALWRVAHQD